MIKNFLRYCALWYFCRVFFVCHVAMELDSQALFTLSWAEPFSPVKLIMCFVFICIYLFSVGPILKWNVQVCIRNYEDCLQM